MQSKQNTKLLRISMVAKLKV